MSTLTGSGERAVAASRLALLGPGLEVPDDQLAVAVLGRQCVDEPGAVARRPG
jgi:hypothetical protein